MPNLPVVLVLTEDTLTSADVDHITRLHAEDPVAYRVLVPADTERNVVTSIIDHLGMGELRRAWDDLLGREPDARQATATAAEQLEGSVKALRATGAEADGFVTADDPLPALRAEVERLGGEAAAPGAAAGPAAGDAPAGVREAVVVTYPHAVEDTFHSDWASRARDELHVPVLHLYLGTSELG
ncbi:hypothetical protein [Puerhibacterium puerhi]|uniref:hypothetical protein n=1 Tax=Puerhibacterium puerhi TaxID=2692623 RepID=UPI0013595349|nr:hypothetical protein [Puerhibacterium puerhi]